VIATEYGFVIYPRAGGIETRLRQGVITSTDGITWSDVRRGPIIDVEEAVQSEDFILEIPESTRQPIQLTKASWIFDSSAHIDSRAPSYTIDLAVTGENSNPYPIAALAIDGGFLIAGGDFQTQMPALWRLTVSDDLTPERGTLEAELVFSGFPEAGRATGPFSEFLHLTRAGDRYYAVAGSPVSGSTELWLSSDLTNEAIAPDDLANALGADTINTLSEQTGLPRDELLTGLSQNLPDFVDQLTPEGHLPTEEEASRW
jgi:hypothetical protein